MKRILLLAITVAVVAVGCGSDSDDSSSSTTLQVVDGADTGGSQTTEGGTSATATTGSGNGNDGTTSTDDTSGSDDPDNDDAADILGNPDLDLDDLPDDVADALDDIDDIVSIGDCSSEVVGLAITAPEGWMCRVLDQVVAGMDGFTLFTEGNQLNISITTPSPFGEPCELLGACGSAVPIQLSDNFPDTITFSLAGTQTISGTHKDVDADLVVTNFTALTDEELAFVSEVLDSAVLV